MHSQNHPIFKLVWVAFYTFLELPDSDSRGMGNMPRIGAIEGWRGMERTSITLRSTTDCLIVNVGKGVKRMKPKMGGGAAGESIGAVQEGGSTPLRIPRRVNV